MRQEVIQSFETATVRPLAPGVELRILVGSHNGARNLFTGLITLAPGASYPYYVRPFSEALILLGGDAAVDVEDRRYRLGPLDSINITAQRPRRLVNLSAGSLATFHLSLASAVPDQTWVNGRFTVVERPGDAIGRQNRSGCAATIRPHNSNWHHGLASKIFLVPSLVPRGSAAATVCLNRVRDYRATVMSLTSQSRSCREWLPVWWRAVAIACRATPRPSCPKAAATTLSI